MKKAFIIITGVFFVLSFGLYASAIHDLSPAETQKPDQPAAPYQFKQVQPARDVYTLRALINLLEKKGIISEKELNEEIERLKSRQ
jgi:hypothetical protein